jgi:hypothetical protein
MYLQFAVIFPPFQYISEEVCGPHEVQAFALADVVQLAHHSTLSKAASKESVLMAVISVCLLAIALGSIQFRRIPAILLLPEATCCDHG